MAELELLADIPDEESCILEITGVEVELCIRDVVANTVGIAPHEEEAVTTAIVREIILVCTGSYENAKNSIIALSPELAESGLVYQNEVVAGPGQLNTILMAVAGRYVMRFSYWLDNDKHDNDNDNDDPEPNGPPPRRRRRLVEEIDKKLSSEIELHAEELNDMTHKAHQTLTRRNFNIPGAATAMSVCFIGVSFKDVSLFERNFGRVALRCGPGLLIHDIIATSDILLVDGVPLLGRHGAGVIAGPTLGVANLEGYEKVCLKAPLRGDSGLKILGNDVTNDIPLVLTSTVGRRGVGMIVGSAPGIVKLAGYEKVHLKASVRGDPAQKIFDSNVICDIQPGATALLGRHDGGIITVPMIAVAKWSSYKKVHFKVTMRGNSGSLKLGSNVTNDAQPGTTLVAGGRAKNAAAQMESVQLAEYDRQSPGIAKSANVPDAAVCADIMQRGPSFGLWLK